MVKRIQFIAWSFVIVGLLVVFYFLYKASTDGYSVWPGDSTDYTVSGQFGDFIGGVVGTLFALAGTLLIFLTFLEQARENKRNAFEGVFYQMLNIHRENVNELTYEKYKNNKERTYQRRQVIKVIFDEFFHCYRDVVKFSSSDNEKDYFQEDYRLKLREVVDKINPEINLIQLAKIDIAYLIVFYGIGEEGEVVIRENFKKKYNSDYYFKLLFFLKAKPKKSNKARFKKWNEIRKLPLPELKVLIDILYEKRANLEKVDSSSLAGSLKLHLNYEKYYGGHQFRLGHYFRHLYQSYKYLNYQEHLSQDEKYQYAKTYRAQLSTYEQGLLFINSLSTIGMRWEYCPETPPRKEIRTDLITAYNLIKNLPGDHFYGIKYETYYKNVDYESKEQFF